MNDVTYRAVLGKNGEPRGFYPSDIFPPGEDGKSNPKVPREAVEISAEVYRALIENQSRARYINGKVEMREPIAAPPAPNTIPTPPNPLDAILERLERLEKRR